MSSPINTPMPTVLRWDSFLAHVGCSDRRSIDAERTENARSYEWSARVGQRVDSEVWVCVRQSTSVLSILLTLVTSPQLHKQSSRSSATSQVENCGKITL